MVGTRSIAFLTNCLAKRLVVYFYLMHKANVNINNTQTIYGHDKV